MNRPLSLSLLLETVISNLDRRWVPKRAGYKLSGFDSPTSLLWEMWSWLHRLEMLVIWINSIQLWQSLLISHWRQPLLQCCDSLMSWMKCPEFLAHTSMGKHLKIHKPPFPLHPFFLCCPGSQHLFPQDGPGNLVHLKSKEAAQAVCPTSPWLLRSHICRQRLAVQGTKGYFQHKRYKT